MAQQVKSWLKIPKYHSISALKSWILLFDSHLMIYLNLLYSLGLFYFVSTYELDHVLKL